MTAIHLEFLLDEPSMEAFLGVLLPRMLPEGCTFVLHPFQGKTDLLAKLEARLRAYAKWLPDDWRIVVILDRDNDDCTTLKQHLEDIAAAAELRTRAQNQGLSWQVVTRLAIEELEAWYFGDWPAVCNAYPRVSSAIPGHKAFRDPDAISGGTWEAFERVLKRYGYFKSGLRKTEAARAVGAHVAPERSRSESFSRLCTALTEATS
jgi:hypothetical protein